MPEQHRSSPDQHVIPAFGLATREISASVSNHCPACAQLCLGMLNNLFRLGGPPYGYAGASEARKLAAKSCRSTAWLAKISRILSIIFFGPMLDGNASGTIS